MSDNQKRLFIVEDDETIASLLAEHFEAWGMEVFTVGDFSRVMETFDACRPHMVLMDISLPVRSGFFYCREMRKSSDAPIIFISSASDNMNILTAINTGADDFIAKPFDLAILTAKVQALMRRVYDFSSPSDIAEYGGLTLNTADATASVGGEKLELTRNEYRILSVLMASPGKIVSRDTLMEKLWATDSFVDENALSVNVTRLRRKLEAAGLPDFIKTRKGMGYMI